MLVIRGLKGLLGFLIRTAKVSAHEYLTVKQNHLLRCLVIKDVLLMADGR